MNNRGALGLIAALLLLGPGARFAQNEASGQNAAAGRAAGNRANVHCTNCGEEPAGPWRAACDFFELARDPEKKEWECVPKSASLRFLIATVPDPKLTHLTLYFDRSIESITTAADAAGYSMQGFWIPWSTQSEPDLLLLKDREEHDKKADDTTHQPGLLVFHRPAADGFSETTLFVFLVGETPTSGVNRTALAGAVHAVCDLREPDEPIPFSGPVYSGALEQLGRDLALLECQKKPVSVRMVSGTVTNKSAIDQITAVAATKLGPNSTFLAMAHDDTQALNLFLTFVKDRLSSPRRIGMLAESGTVYGAIPTASTQPLLFMHYPREIARLRNASSQEVGQASPKTEPTVNEGLKLTLKDSDSEAPQERVPSFSTLQSPASQQAVLAAISGTLRRERVDLAGILASDILDSVFLDRYLRLTAPDTRLFMMDADLLVSRDVETAPLTGMLAISSYPLFSRAQHWMNPAPGSVETRTQFSSQYSEAVYNSVRLLLYDRPADYGQPALLDYARPFPPSSGIEQGSARPPLWLNVLGRDGYWPVALIDENSQDSTGAPSPKQIMVEASLNLEAPSFAWFATFWAVVMFALLHCAYWPLVKAIEKNKQPPGWMRRSQDVLCAIFPAYPRRWPQPNEYPFLLVGSLAIFCALLVFTVCALGFRPVMPSLLVPAVFGIIALVLLLAVSKRLGALKKSWIAWQAWILTAAFAAGWIWWCRAENYRAGEFFMYRSFTLTSGVSPAVPMLLLIVTIYCWAWTHLKRQKDSNDRDAALLECQRQLQNETAATKDRSDEHAANIDRVLCDSGSWELMAKAGPLFLLWIVAFMPWQHAISFEHRTYNFVYWVLLGEVYLLMALAWVQFIRGWHAFKVYLEYLENQPVRKAFSKLQGHIVWMPLVAKMPGQLLFISTRCRDSLLALAALDRSSMRFERRIELDDLAARIDKLDPEIAANMAEVQANLEERTPYYLLQAAFEKARRWLTADLEKNSWKEGASESLETALRPEGSKGDPPSLDEQVAIIEQEFVALRHLIFMRYVFRQLRTLLGFMGTAFILSVISMTAYPFQARQWIGIASLMTLLALGAGAVMVFAQMDRDAILSRITKTNANELNKTFFLRTAQFGALPLLTLLASQFPSINHYIFSWAQPALEALK